MDLSDRQRQAVTRIKTVGRITNKEYQELAGVTDRTALRNLDEMLSKGMLAKVGTTGRGTFYVLKERTRQKHDKTTKDRKASSKTSRGTTSRRRKGNGRK